jgi:hypothetical protein
MRNGPKELVGLAALSLAAFALNKHRIAGVYGAFHPEFRYQPSAPPEVLGGAGAAPMGVEQP